MSTCQRIYTQNATTPSVGDVVIRYLLIYHLSCSNLVSLNLLSVIHPLDELKVAGELLAMGRDTTAEAGSHQQGVSAAGKETETDKTSTSTSQPRPKRQKTK